MTSHPEFGKTTTCEEVVDAFTDAIHNKTVVITGVSPNGLGEAMAKALASKNPARLVFTARSIWKAESVAADIRASHPSKEILCVQLDLSSNESVHAAAVALQEIVPKIDIIINNAGVMAIPERMLSVDGHEMHFATNFLGHFLFINLLMSKLARNARVVNVTSGGYAVCPVRFHDLAWEGNKRLPVEEEPDMALAKQLGIGELVSVGSYNPILAYLHSNTATMLFTTGLRKRLQSAGAVAISAAPGVVMTELQRHIGGFRNPAMEYKTPSQGGASLLVAALDPSLQHHTGAYIDNCQVTEIVADHAKNEQIAEKLWAMAEGMTCIKERRTSIISLPVPKDI